MTKEKKREKYIRCGENEIRKKEKRMKILRRKRMNEWMTKKYDLDENKLGSEKMLVRKKKNEKGVRNEKKKNVDFKLREKNKNKWMNKDIRKSLLIKGIKCNKRMEIGRKRNENTKEKEKRERMKTKII